MAPPTSAAKKSTRGGKTKSATIVPTGSAARTGESVARRRFQQGTVFQNKTRTMWLGQFTEYVCGTDGVERRIRRQETLCPVKVGDTVTRKREAQRLLQPFLDRVNASISAPAKERKHATFEEFADIWERDYLSQSKQSTQAGMRSVLRRLRAALGKKDMRRIDAGDIQRIIAQMSAEGISPKSVRNVWGVVSLLFTAAHAQKFIDVMIPKPKLPRRPKGRPRMFTLPEVAKVIAASQVEQKALYWLLAETGLRSGELAGLKLTDIAGESLTVNRSVWRRLIQTPKTDNALRTLALSPQLISLLWEQIARQKAKGHEYLFSCSNRSPIDMAMFRDRKMCSLLTALKIERKGFHAFRHFNVALMDALRVPLKVIQERIGHAFTGSFTLDVYGGKPEWSGNLEAARLLGAALEKAVRETEEAARPTPICSLTTIEANGSEAEISQAVSIQSTN